MDWYDSEKEGMIGYGNLSLKKNYILFKMYQTMKNI